MCLIVKYSHKAYFLVIIPPSFRQNINCKHTPVGYYQILGKLLRARNARAGAQGFKRSKDVPVNSFGSLVRGDSEPRSHASKVRVVDNRRREKADGKAGIVLFCPQPIGLYATQDAIIHNMPAVPDPIQNMIVGYCQDTDTL